MYYDPRDRQLLHYVARFKQLTARQARALVFADVSERACNRALKRLTDAELLARIERRIAGGANGGSGQYVYQLGKQGHPLYREGRYSPARAINHHALCIVDTYLLIQAKQAQQQLTVLVISTEPDCHRQIGRHYLKPDLFAEIERPDGERKQYWFEIDLGSETQSRIREKLTRYWQAYNDANEADWPQWPLVVFVAVDKHRADELAWLVKQGPKEAQPLFRVATLESLAAARL